MYLFLRVQTSVTFKVLSIWCINLSRGFFYLSKQVFNSSILMLFSTSAVFYFTSFTLAKSFSLRIFFIWGNKKIIWGEIGCIGRVDHGVHAIFGQKLLNIQHGVTGTLVNHPSWDGEMCWKSLKKNSLKLSAASHNHTS